MVQVISNPPQRERSEESEKQRREALFLPHLADPLRTTRLTAGCWSRRLRTRSRLCRGPCRGGGRGLERRDDDRGAGGQSTGLEVGQQEIWDGPCLCRRARAGIRAGF